MTSRVRLLCGCYRKGDASDPGTFVVAVATVLLGYPPDIVVSVTDPGTGLPSKLQWLPSVAEVKAECERLMALRYAPEKPKALPEPNWKPDPQSVRDEAVKRWQHIRAGFGADGKAPEEPSEIVKALVADDMDEARRLCRAQFAGGLTVSEELLANIAASTEAA